MTTIDRRARRHGILRPKLRRVILQTTRGAQEAVPALVYGAWRDIDPDHPAVFGYTRTLPDASCLVLMNFGREPVAYRLPAGVVAGDILLSSEVKRLDTRRAHRPPRRSAEPDPVHDCAPMSYRRRSRGRG